MQPELPAVPVGQPQPAVRVGPGKEGGGGDESRGGEQDVGPEQLGRDGAGALQDDQEHGEAADRDGGLRRLRRRRTWGGHFAGHSAKHCRIVVSAARPSQESCRSLAGSASAGSTSSSIFHR